MPSQRSWWVRTITSAGLQQLGVRAGEQPRAVEHVAAHDRHLVVGQAAGLEQDAVGHADLADVVQDAGVADQVGLGGGQPELERDLAAEPAHALDVIAGVVVAQLRGLREPHDDFELGVRELRGARVDRGLELGVVAGGARARGDRGRGARGHADRERGHERGQRNGDGSTLPCAKASCAAPA